MKKIVIHRTRIGKDIVAEFAVPTSEKQRAQGRVAILCQGAPGMPGKSSLMDFLARKGFYVVLPRYRGTWESAGKFLETDPTEDVREVLEAVHKPLVSLYEETAYQFPKNPKIYIFSSSFGGSAGLLLSGHKKVERVVAFSPVTDWRAQSDTEPLPTMNTFTKLVYGEGYRLSKKGWMKLAKGDFFNPITALQKIKGSKILIFHAKDDDVVPLSASELFADDSGATLMISKRGGHFGLNEVMEPETWREIYKFIK